MSVTDNQSDAVSHLKTVTPRQGESMARFARRTGAACAECGTLLPPEGPVYRRRVTRFDIAVLCESCGPRFMLMTYGINRWPCVGCGRVVVFEESGRDWYRDGIACSDQCRSRRLYAKRADRLRGELYKSCEVCGKTFTGTRRDAKTCSPACKQRAYRQRKQEARI